MALLDFHQSVIVFVTLRILNPYVCLRRPAEFQCLFDRITQGRQMNVRYEQRVNASYLTFSPQSWSSPPPARAHRGPS